MTAGRAFILLWSAPWSQQPEFHQPPQPETSPYLKHHAHNPVDWYAWGPEALERARQLDRPIFLSIGYSRAIGATSWSTRASRTPRSGRLLNDHFVSIKVDREERPDLGSDLHDAVQC